MEKPGAGSTGATSTAGLLPEKETANGTLEAMDQD